MMRGEQKTNIKQVKLLEGNVINFSIMADDHLVRWFATGFASEYKLYIYIFGNPKCYLCISKQHFQNYISDLQLRTTNLDDSDISVRSNVLLHETQKH